MHKELNKEKVQVGLLLEDGHQDGQVQVFHNHLGLVGELLVPWGLLVLRELDNLEELPGELLEHLLHSLEPGVLQVGALLDQQL